MKYIVFFALLMLVAMSVSFTDYSQTIPDVIASDGVSMFASATVVKSSSTSISDTLSISDHVSIVKTSSASTSDIPTISDSVLLK